jgi:hypothetical protein
MMKPVERKKKVSSAKIDASPAKATFGTLVHRWQLSLHSWEVDCLEACLIHLGITQTLDRILEPVHKSDFVRNGA